MATVKIVVGAKTTAAERKKAAPTQTARGSATAEIQPPSGQRSGDAHIVCSACGALNWLSETEKTSRYFTCWSCAYVGRRLAPGERAASVK